MSDRFASSLFFQTLHCSGTISNECLAHRSRMVLCVRIVGLVDSVSGVGARAVSMQALSTWWPMHQIKSGIRLWRSNPAMTLALEQSLDLLPASDFITRMWPSNEHLLEHNRTLNGLVECCRIAGVHVPIRFMPSGTQNSLIIPSQKSKSLAL